MGYLYNTRYSILHYDNSGKTLRCSHREDHSINVELCYLWPFALVINMYALGDKYDVPGLKAYSCVRLQELFDLNAFTACEHEMEVWEFAYEKSRSTDELRELLFNQICKKLFGPRGASLRRHKSFHAFIDRVPEMAGALFKACLENL